MTTAVTVTARCTGRGCGWTAAGGWPAVDRAAEKHVRAGHPTVTLATPATTTERKRP
jgi:hypothetical protein